MKRVVACVMIVAFVANCGITIRKKEPSEPTQKVQRYPLEIGEYGEEIIVIDAEERDAVGLFQDIEGFREARFTGSADGGYEVEIATDTRNLVSVNKDPNGMAIMREYLVDYENIKDDPLSFETRWGILDYDALGAPITQSEVNRYMDSGKALTRGCAGGCIAAGVAGLVVGSLAIAATQDAGASGADMSVGIGIMVGGAVATVLAAVIAGGSVGCLTGRGVSKSDRRKAVETIKEQRKPKMIEQNGEG